MFEQSLDCDITFYRHFECQKWSEKLLCCLCLFDAVLCLCRGCELITSSCRCEKGRHGAFTLHYYSSREGLYPFVIGTSSHSLMSSAPVLSDAIFSFLHLYYCHSPHSFVFQCVCVCVCVRERERVRLLMLTKVPKPGVNGDNASIHFKMSGKQRDTTFRKLSSRCDFVAGILTITVCRHSNFNTLLAL